MREQDDVVDGLGDGTVPTLDPTPDSSHRRWSDRPGRTPVRTFARLLTASPGLDEVTRCLVGILAWPIGATGALIVRHEADGLRTLARYEEPIDPEIAMPSDQGPAPCVSDIVLATTGSGPALWTEPGHRGCRPMAAWPLESTNAHVDHLVLILAAPESAAVVTERVEGIPQVLAVYLAGAEAAATNGAPSRPADSSTAVGLSERQSRILELMAQDLTMQQIASRIGFSDSTVRMESLAIYRALGVHDRHHAVEAAQERGLLPPERFQGGT
jgi:DNA-binding CsgD family transcriptional regulator